MEPNAYPQPESFDFDRIKVRQALPVYPPPEPLELPALPTPLRKPSFEAPYKLTTHIIPASYLRTTRLAPEPELPPRDAPKEEQVKVLAKARQELIDLRTSKVTDGYPRIMWNCLNRYVKQDLDKSKGTGITLFLAHANGFPKEIWEPFLGYLLNSSADSIIDEVWAWESVQHGDAGLLNKNLASGIFDWHDNGRDIANFFLNFIPSLASSEPLPVHLSRLTHQEAESRKEFGFANRKVVVVGHSYGGCTSAFAAQLHPKLFTSLILVDPVIIPPYDTSYIPPNKKDLASGALARRDTWSSREEALTSFNANPFFRAWDPDVLRIYVECGTYDSKDQTDKPVVNLKMSGVQEAVVFAEVHTQFEVFQQMSELDERIAIRWVMPGKPGAPELGPPGCTEYKVWLRPVNSTNVKIFGGGHLIVQEAPKELADDVEKFFRHQFQAIHGTTTRPRF